MDRDDAGRVVEAAIGGRFESWVTPATPSPIESISTGEVGPLRTTRYADDPEGAADLATLIGVLARGRAAPASGRP